jgi:hypothetical protein
MSWFLLLVLLLQVACTLFYSDVNVTELAPDSRVRLCNPDWQDIREFNAVAYEVGSARYRRIPQKQEVRVIEWICLQAFVGSVMTILGLCSSHGFMHEFDCLA